MSRTVNGSVARSLILGAIILTGSSLYPGLGGVAVATGDGCVSAALVHPHPLRSSLADRDRALHTAGHLSQLPAACSSHKGTRAFELAKVQVQQRTASGGTTWVGVYRAGHNLARGNQAIHVNTLTKSKRSLFGSTDARETGRVRVEYLMYWQPHTVPGESATTPSAKWWFQTFKAAGC